MPFRLSPMTKADLPGIGRAAVAAYKGDVLTRNLWSAHLRWYRDDDPDHYVDEETPARIEGFRKRMRRPGTVSLVVEDEDASDPADASIRRIVGAAQYVEPELRMDGSVRYEKEPYPDPTEEKYPRSFDAAKLLEFGSIFKAQAVTFGPENVKQMWYLYIIFTDPEYQRKGIGGMLLDWGIERAKEDKTDLFLEASENGKKLCRSRGFEAVAEMMLWGEGPFQRMVWRGREERIPYGKLPKAEVVPVTDAAKEKSVA